MDKILLTGVRLEVRLGVAEEERAETQTIIVDIECECDLRPAGRSDDISQTIDYTLIHQALRSAATSRPYLLVETMAEEMAKAVLTDFDVDSIRIRLQKPAALRSQSVDWAGIEILRNRRV